MVNPPELHLYEWSATTLASYVDHIGASLSEYRHGDMFVCSLDGCRIAHPDPLGRKTLRWEEVSGIGDCPTSARLALMVKLRGTYVRCKGANYNAPYFWGGTG